MGAPVLRSGYNGFMESNARTTPEDVAREVDALVDECRTRCLWYIRRDYYPRTDEERRRVLDAIQQHADVRTFKRAGRLMRWLSPPSNAGSTGS